VGKVSDSNNDVNWERKVLEKLALEALAEQRRGRRWGIFFKLLGFGYLALVLVLALDLGSGDKVAEGEKFTALVNLNGVIKAKGDSNAEDVISSLQAAFEDKHTAGVILRINSPGGSPVQSGIINDEMRRLRGKHPAVPLLRGSRGCLCLGRLLRRRGGGPDLRRQGQHRRLDRGADGRFRLHRQHGQARRGTSPADGRRQNKGFLDPFSPENENSTRQHAQAAAGRDSPAVHRSGAQRPRQAAQGNAGAVLSGLMWSGARSIELGLVDEYGTRRIASPAMSSRPARCAISASSRTSRRSSPNSSGPRWAKACRPP
jgi:protease-4